jgi:putative SOS response-associated peptidase YedK
MCGRYSMTKKQMRVVSRFADTTAELEFLPRFNIAPTQACTVLRLTDGRLIVDTFTWGLRPVWSKGPIINAKGETLMQKPTFKQALLQRRCLVPADAFYEWQSDGIRKRPMRIFPASGEPFCFGGLWETSPGGSPESSGSFLIITTAANDFMQPIHLRMPLILGPADYDGWLDPATNDYQSLLQRACPLPLQAVEVNARINNARNDDPACVEPPERELLL